MSSPRSGGKYSDLLGNVYMKIEPGYRLLANVARERKRFLSASVGRSRASVHDVVCRLMGMLRVRQPKSSAGVHGRLPAIRFCLLPVELSAAAVLLVASALVSSIAPASLIASIDAKDDLAAMRASLQRRSFHSHLSEAL